LTAFPSLVSLQAMIWLRAYATPGKTRSSGFTTGTALLLAAALAIASALGYWGVGAYRTSQLQRSVTALVKDTSERLRDALAVETAKAAEESPRTVSKLDEHAQEVDKHVIELRGAGTSIDRDLVNAAEEYMLTVRQILRNQAASHRYHIQVVSGDRALRDHMGNAKRRSPSWIKEALRAKDRLERAYFDYRLSVEAFGRLLASYPQARRRLAQHLAAGLLLGEDYVGDVARRVAENAKRTAVEVEKARQLAAVK